MQKLFLNLNLIAFIIFASPSSYSETKKFTEKKYPSEMNLNLFRSTRNIEITSEEWQRYETLSKGLRGFQSPQLDPVTSLGVEARNDAERRHYAELWVKQEYERTEKELKFQREVDAAWKRLMPNMLPVNMGNAAGIAHDSGGRLALFVREADCQRCDARLSAVLADKRPVDIYLVDSEGSDQKLRNWAQQHRIPAEQVRERRITPRCRPLDALRQRHHAGSTPAGGKRMAYRCVLTASLMLSIASSLASTSMQSVPSGYQKVALQYGVPAESLYSLAFAESSRQLPHGTRPWPWTINVAGKGYRYESRQAAWQALQQFMKIHPLKRIDVGIAQVNLGWNGHRFNSTWDAFDPYTNLNAAARILRECWERSPGSWLTAAGCYHHPAGGKPAARYRQIVSQKLASLAPIQPRPIETQAPANLASNQAPSTEIIWTEPRRQQ